MSLDLIDRYFLVMYTIYWPKRIWDAFYIIEVKHWLTIREYWREILNPLPIIIQEAGSDNEE